MKFQRMLAVLAAAAGIALAAPPAPAQTIKIGVINTYSGPFATLGDLIDKGFKLYMKQNADKLPPGVKIELVIRDDGGPNPDKAKQLAQELIVRDKVQILTGVVLTPNALAIAPLTTEAKVPFFIMNAGTSVITERSPYIARFSFTLWQSCYPLGAWAAKKYKTRLHRGQRFRARPRQPRRRSSKGFTEGGGKIVGNVRIPLANPDFVPFMQRVEGRQAGRGVRVRPGRQARRPR